MGSLKKMLGMMPGMAQMKAQLDSIDEREFDRVEAMVRSMTPQERQHPKIINGSRRARIARGSGRTVADVNSLLQRLTEAQKMMKQMRRGMGVPGMPGLPGMAGTGPGRKAKGKQKKKGKSGNPAKRAEQERLAAQRAEQNRGAAALERMDPGAAFGQGNESSAEAVEKLSQGLPPGFEKFLGR
jgi:signal recognition particle subunit SRP54